MEKIDNIFEESFKNFKTDLPEDEWFELDMKLTRNNFFNFSFYHFNVFYAAIFLISSLFSITAGVDYFFLNKKNHKSESKIEINTLGNTEKIIQESESSSNNNTNDFNNKEEITQKTELNTEFTPESETKDENLYQPDDIENNKEPTEISNLSVENNVRDTIKSNTIALDSSENTKFDTILENDTLKNQKHVKKVIFIKEDDVILRDTVFRYEKRKKRK